MVKATTVTWWVPWNLCSLNIMAWRKHLCLNRKILQLSTCVSDRKDVVWLIGHQLFQRKPEERAVFSLCNHTAVKIERDAVWNQTAMRPAAVAKEFVPVSCEHDQRHVNLKLDLISYNSVKRWKKKKPWEISFSPWQQDVQSVQLWRLLCCPPSRSGLCGVAEAGPQYAAHTGQTGMAEANQVAAGR